MARGLISSVPASEADAFMTGSHPAANPDYSMGDHDMGGNGTDGSGNGGVEPAPKHPTSVLEPGPSPEPKITRSYVTPGGREDRAMSPDVRAIPISNSGRNTIDSDNYGVLFSNFDGDVRRSNPGENVADFTKRVSGERSKEYAEAHPGEPTPNNPPRAGFIPSDPFTHPEDFRSVPGSDKMEYAPKVENPPAGH